MSNVLGTNAAAEESMDAAALHGALLTLDTHLDTSVHFGRPGWHFDERHDFDTDLSQVDMPRMAGTLDGGFFVVYVPPGPLTPEGFAAAKASAFQRSDNIDAMIARHADRIELATTPADAARLKSQGKFIAFKSIENCYPLGEDLDLLADFYRRGVRLASPVHVRNNQFGDSSTDKPEWNGLSPLGLRWLHEMNRLGIVADASHASDDVFDQMVDLSTSPIILSHSGARAIFDHPRNIDDARIRKLADSGGVLCFATVFLSAMNGGAERLAVLRALDEVESLDPQAHALLVERWHALEKEAPMWSATLDDYMAALLHVIDVAGIDHVGFGADWDGGAGVRDLEDVTALPRVTERLIKAGLSKEDLTKLWGGNVMRVLARAQTIASGN